MVKIELELRDFFEVEMVVTDASKEVLRVAMDKTDILPLEFIDEFVERHGGKNKTIEYLRKLLVR